MNPENLVSMKLRDNALRNPVKTHAEPLRQGLPVVNQSILGATLLLLIWGIETR